MNFRKPIHRFLVAILVSTLFSSSCKKGGCNVIPDVAVMERISLVEYPELLLPNQAVAVNRGGVAGLIIVHLGNNRYVAFDRCSTVEPHKRCSIQVDGMIGTDPCSKATFMLVNGSPASIAECPLRPYHTSRSGQTIVVSN